MSELGNDRPLVLIDMDEVLFAFLTAVNAYYNEHFGKGLTLADYTTFSLSEVWGCSIDEANDIVHSFLLQDLRHLEPMPGSLEALDRLRQEFRLAVLTARVGLLEQATRLYLLHHFPDHFENIILAGHRFFGSFYQPKYQVALELGASAIVDDNLENVLQCAEVDIYGQVFGHLPHNQTDEPLPDNVERVADWPEAVERLLARKRAGKLSPA